MLGKQAEACFEFYLHSSARYQLIAANLQIQGSENTKGELDYLVFDTQTKKVLHIELACKFYLYDSDEPKNKSDSWIGPNRKDSLHEKLTKLEQKQFPLLYATESLQTLNQLNIDRDSVEQQLCLKSFLYIPKGLSTSLFPHRFSDCIVGYWIPYIEFNSEDKNAIYAIPQKKQWLTPPEKLKDWLSFSEAALFIKVFTEANRSCLVHKKSAQSMESFFVVWW
jgi:hypothetical protein